MVRTRVGYAGGSTKDPSYHRIGDHTETVQVDYDPALISYEKLLDVFWKSHDPTERPWSRQYQVVIFFHNEEQRKLALQSRDRTALSRGTEIRTGILPYTGFTVAEDYHQKFYLRNDYDLMEEFRRIYPDPDKFTASTAAARVNGYLGGYGTLEELERELDSYGLSEAGGKRLLRIVADARTRKSTCPVP
ncbi:MAG: peptide-methionine (S)-S-oxide reductase [Nitrospirae bacterium]|nr:peptide-methionine (S)-S-oxide reductase [Nitrospirota bacterium]